MVITIYRPWEKHYSSVGWRVRLALEEKGLRYETRLVVMKMSEHLTEEILRLNPRGELPILQDVDAVLHEESAMLQYLEQFYPEEPRLMPDPVSEKKAYTDALVLLHEVFGPFSNAVRPLLLHLVSDKPDTAVDPGPIPAMKQSILTELPRWEKLLASTGGPFLMGETLSLADIAFFPYIAHLQRYGLNFNKQFPNIAKYFNLMSERAAVKKTYPSGWTGTPTKPWLK